MALRTAICCFVLLACLSSVYSDKTRSRYTNYPQYNEENVPQMATNNLYDYLEQGAQVQERFRDAPAASAPAVPSSTNPTAITAPSASSVLPPEPAAASAPIVIGPANTPQPSGPQPVRIPTQSQQQQIQAQQAEEADPDMVKLDSALEAVKEDIMTNSKKIADEKKKWVKAVTKITASYEEKVKRVEEHIIVLRKEQKKIIHKKETNRKS